MIDALVHGQDIAVPLGIAWPCLPTPPLRPHSGCGARFPFNPQRRLRGIRFTATDVEFSVGQGRSVEAPIRDILMLFAGRPASISADVSA